MTAVYALCMKPVICSPSLSDTEIIVHRIIASDKDTETVVRLETQWSLCPDFFLSGILFRPQITGGDQFPADLRQITFRFRTFDFIHNAVQIVELSRVLFDKLCKMLSGILELVVFLVFLRRILLWSFQRIQQDYPFRTIRFIEILTGKRSHSLFQFIDICSDEIRFLTDLFPIIRFLHFLPAGIQFPLGAVSGRFCFM